MPIEISIPAKEQFDNRTGRFIATKACTIQLEHSLLSIVKWESKWHKPYMAPEKKTGEETIDYIRFMCLTKVVDPNVFYSLDAASIQKIAAYIDAPMTATTFRKNSNDRPSREIVTNELIYYWMTELNIPFEPCQKWHLNRLLTLIKVASIKKAPGKKMSKQEMLSQRAALNAQRKAKYGTHG